MNAPPCPGTPNWDTDQPVDPNGLHDVLASPASHIWSGTTIGGEESFDGIWLSA